MRRFIETAEEVGADDADALTPIPQLGWSQGHRLPECKSCLKPWEAAWNEPPHLVSAAQEEWLPYSQSQDRPGARHRIIHQYQNVSGRKSEARTAAGEECGCMSMDRLEQIGREIAARVEKLDKLGARAADQVVSIGHLLAEAGRRTMVTVDEAAA
jgi:hypothetical protein